MRQTKAHNGLTVSGVGQWVRNYAAGGRIAAFARKADYAYACGDACRAYGDRLSLFRRHVLFVDYRYFLLLDDLQSPVETTFETHWHGFEPIQTDPARRAARIRRADAFLDVNFLRPIDLRFYATDQLRPGQRRPRFPRPAPPAPPPRRDGPDDADRPAGDAAGARPGGVSPGQPGSERFRLDALEGEGMYGVRVVQAESSGPADQFLIATGDEPIRHDGQTRDAAAVWLRDGEVKFAIPR